MSAAEACDPDYWIAQALSPVRFQDGLSTILAEGPHILVEVGPGRTLGGFARRHAARSPEMEIVATLPHGSDDARATITAIAELYVQGCEIDWHAFNAGRKRQLVSLPPYPFRATRYAVDMITDLAPTTAQPEASAPSESREVLFLPTWERRPRRGAQALAGTTWIIGPARSEMTRTIAAAVDRANGRLVQLPATANQRDMTDRLRAGAPDRILHLALLHDDGSDRRELGYASLLRIGAALHAANVAAPIDVIVAARRVFAVDSTDRPDPDAALLLGPAIVLGQEQPNVKVRIIDIGQDVQDAAVTAACAAPSAAISALRGNRLLERSFRPAGAIDQRIRLDGHYLVTGGLGRLGLTVARELASRYGARLSLVGRSVPDDLGQRLAAVTDMGGAAEALSCDVTDTDALTQAVRSAEATFGPVDGIIHMAAETRAFASIPDTDDATSQRMLAAKVAGLQALEKVLGHRDLSVRILMSSLASVLGGLGFASYAAANAWLDAYAEASGRWASLCWDAWAEGLQADDVATARYALTTSRAVDAIERVVAGGLTGQIVVCGGALDQRLANWTALAGDTATAEKNAVDETDRVRGIRDIFAEVLGRADLAHDGDFFDLGGDSLQAIQVVSRLRSRFALPVTPDLLFAHATPVRLAAALDRLVATQASPADLTRPVSEEARRMVEVMSGDEVNRMLERLLAEGQPT
ncbi:hypothetical protein BRAO375_850016 [Bradyrhizobium sp. ORS 375]|nr:hypothetical protein BRAO375_850016 [Bradyrhizobium sp. ORS 375]